MIRKASASRIVVAMVAFFICQALQATSLPPTNNIARPSPAIDRARDARACRAVAAFANATVRGFKKISFAPPDEATEAFLRKRDSYGYVARVDMNGDGKPEYVVQVVDGSAYFTHLEMFDMQWQPIEMARSQDVAWEDNDVFGAEDMNLIRFEGRLYVLGSSDEVLRYLSRVDPDNTERIVCQYWQRPQPLESIKKSKNGPLCRAALGGRLAYAKFEESHFMANDFIADRANFPGIMSHVNEAAKVDVNNDGQPRYVANLAFSSGHGRGCSGSFLGVLNGARDGLDTKPTMQLMKENHCSAEQALFSFAGEQYIETKYTEGRSANYHKVVQMKHGKVRTICEFDVSPHQIIVTPAAKKRQIEKEEHEFMRSIGK